MSDGAAAHQPYQPAAPRMTTGRRIPELDGLRGIAILMVLFFHFTPASGPLFFLAHVLQTGWGGVDLFFVLSGYLITGILIHSVSKPHYYRNFIVRRTLRIFPLYYACMLLYAFLTYYPSAIHWKEFLGVGDAGWYVAYLGNVQAFLKNAWPGAAILTPLWSLQVEEQYYLSFPLIVRVLNRKALTRLLLGCTVVALLLRIILVFAMPGNKVGTYLLMPCRMDALAMGGLVAIAESDAPDRLRTSWIGRLTILSALIFILVCVLFGEAPWSDAMRTVGFTALDAAMTGVLILLITGQVPGLVRLCRTRWLRWLGTISYGLYLLHIPARTMADNWIAPWSHLAIRGTAELLLCLAISICMASLSWLAFESQILKLKDRFTVR